MPCWVCRGDRHRERDITRRRRRWWRRRRKRRTFTTRSRRGGGSPTRGTYTRFARRIASKNICRRESREEKKIRGRIRHTRGRQRKREEREGEFSYPAVLIWPSECDDTRRDATSSVERRSWSDFVRARERPNDFISGPSSRRSRQRRYADTAVCHLVKLSCLVS